MTKIILLTHLPWSKAVEMDLKRPIKVLVISALICYTTVTVFEAARKLREGKIGTLFRKINEDTVEGSAVNMSENYASIKNSLEYFHSILH